MSTTRREAQRSPVKAAPSPDRGADIHDVAKRAGVSVKTVSRVLNGEANVTEKTRQLVMETIGALSYRPNEAARGLASQTSRLVGLLFDNPSAAYVAGVQLGAMNRCRDEGCHLIVEMFDSGAKDLCAKVLKLVEESTLHGLVLTPPLCDAPLLIDALTRAGVRFVAIAPQRRLSGALEVSIDDARAAFDMTKYLIGLGHRRIGFIRGHPGHGAAHQRFDGFCAAHNQAGMPIDPELCARGYFSYQSGLEAAEQLLRLKHPPTAIFAANDDMAAATLSAAHKLGLRTPEDLSVSGFDDSLIAQVVWPQLTTCRQPIAEMASAAVAMLIEPGTASGRLEHEIVVRESTAPPAALVSV